MHNHFLISISASTSQNLVLKSTNFRYLIDRKSSTILLISFGLSILRPKCLLLENVLYNDGTYDMYNLFIKKIDLATVICIIILCFMLNVVQKRFEIFAFATFVTIYYFQPGTIGLTFSVFSCFFVDPIYSVDSTYRAILNKSYFFHDTTL